MHTIQKFKLYEIISARFFTQYMHGSCVSGWAYMYVQRGEQ